MLLSIDTYLVLNPENFNVQVDSSVVGETDHILGTLVIGELLTAAPLCDNRMARPSSLSWDG